MTFKWDYSCGVYIVPSDEDLESYRKGHKGREGVSSLLQPFLQAKLETSQRLALSKRWT